MSFKDFVRGQTPQQAQYLRQQEQERLLDAQFQRDELFLKTLRPVEAKKLTRQDLFERWRASKGTQIRRENEDWWSANFPESVASYGPVFLGRIPNLDTIAASLGESPAQVVYSVLLSGFFFKDYSVGAYRPVSDGRLSALVKRIALEACHHAPRSVGEKFLEVRELSEGVVAEAKILLQVEADFFKGPAAPRRYSDGHYIEPVETPMCRIFLAEQIVKADRSVLGLGDAYHRYFEFCSNRAACALPKTSFRKFFNQETKSRFGVGIRNDLRSATGRTFQGWKGLEFADVIAGTN
jgi:hypothetical protein